MAPKNLPIISFDYDFSPYGQKIRTVLAASGASFAVVEQPPMLPRPDLAALGITYRRIPVTAIGRDVYCDSAAITAAVQRQHGGMPRAAPTDAGLAAWGAAVFGACLPVMPQAALTPEFVRDRATIFPGLGSPQFPALRASALAELRHHIRAAEAMLAGGPFVGGASTIGLADLHVAFPLRWFLFNLGVAKEPGFARADMPVLYDWLDRMPSLDVRKIPAADAHKAILAADYVDDELAFDQADPLGIAKGASVQVENRDTKPGAHPQHGRLVGLSTHELVLQLENGIRVHFPRAGYAVFESAKL